MSPVTWQEAAEGIPVWDYGVFMHGGVNRGPCVQVVDLDYEGPHCLSLDSELYPYGECIPALDNPDTQAAYLRRLAVALGCSEELANSLAGCVRYGRWTVVAGCPDGDGVFPWSKCIREDGDRLLALALAWPADKRVSR